MKHAINVGCVADMSEFKLKIEIFFNTLNLQGKRGTVGEVVNNGTDSG